jgi:hypothetical protein
MNMDRNLKKMAVNNFVEYEDDYSTSGGISSNQHGWLDTSGICMWMGKYFSEIILKNSQLINVPAL